MAQHGLSSSLLSDAAGQQQIETDVLVVGGGPAGAWAAIAAAARGASVALVEKGFCGTSGATAPSNGEQRADPYRIAPQPTGMAAGDSVDLADQNSSRLGGLGCQHRRARR